MEGLTAEIEAKQPPVEQWRRFVYCTTLSGPVLGIVDHLRPEGNASSLLSLACCCSFTSIQGTCQQIWVVEIRIDFFSSIDIGTACTFGTHEICCSHNNFRLKDLVLPRCYSGCCCWFRYFSWLVMSKVGSFTCVSHSLCCCRFCITTQSSISRSLFSASPFTTLVREGTTSWRESAHEQFLESLCSRYPKPWTYPDGPWMCLDYKQLQGSHC